MALQLVEERASARLVHALDREGASGDRIERLAPGARVGARDFVADPRYLLLLLGVQSRGGSARSLVEVVAVAVVVARDESLDTPAHGLVQLLVGERLVGEGRARGGARHLQRVEDGAARGHFEVRVIGVEVRSGVGESHRLAVAHHVGKDEDVRVVGVMEGVDPGRLGPAPGARKGRELARIEPLLRKDDEAVLMQRRFDAFEILQRPGDIHTFDARAQHRRKRPHVHLSSSGAMSFGRMSGISGQMMIATSTSSIGTSIMSVSFNANRIGTLATAQQIMRQSPYGGVTSPKASETMPMMAKWIGFMPTEAASGCRIVPKMMIAGIASRKQPTTRNTNAMKKPAWVMPIPHVETFSRSALGIWED